MYAKPSRMAHVEGMPPKSLPVNMWVVVTLISLPWSLPSQEKSSCNKVTIADVMSYASLNEQNCES